MSKPCAFQANSLQQVLLHGSGADTRVCRVETRLDPLRAARAPRRVSALQTRVSAPQGYATLFRRLSVATRTHRLQPVVISALSCGIFSEVDETQSQWLSVFLASHHGVSGTVHLHREG